MIPIEIDLTNFLAYRHPGPLRLEGMHVACLAGPNGAGKSSLLDAITWCLWGKARSNSADDLVHQGQTEMGVTLQFEQSGQRYRVIRQRKTGKRGSSLLELQIRDEQGEIWRSLSEGTIGETQLRIVQLLHLNYDTFVNSAFLMQGRADEFTTKTPGLRKEILASILGLDRWEELETAAKERLRERQSTAQQMDGRIDEWERELAQRSERSESLNQAERQAETLAQELAEAETVWAGLEQSRMDMVVYQRQIDDLTRRIVARQKEIGEGQEEVAQLQLRADASALQAALAETRRSLEELEPLEQRRKQAVETKAELQQEAAGLRGANQALGPETEPIKARVTVLEATSEPTCPTCGQSLDDDHRHRLLTELQAQVTSRREQYRQNRERVEAIEAELAGLETGLGQLEADLHDRPALEKRAGELEAGLSHAAEAADQAANLQARLGRWTDALAQDQAARAQIEASVEQTELALKAASLTQADLDELRRKKRLADERVGGARQQLATLDKVEQQLDSTRSERANVAEQISLLEELREAFSKRGVPAMIIETVVPELERSANELLGRMTDGRLNVRIETQREIKTGELREALDIIISDELGSRPYELYSGGEAFRINFAIRIALSKLLANRAGAQLRSLFIDEGFGTQDARGREQLVEAINAIQDDFERILVITHIEELKDAFPTRIEVRKTPEGSTFSLN
jgi:exonuclease SbcC